MDDPAVVAPPYLAPPFRLHEFSALRLAPGRVGDPASARAFARPYRSVVKRLQEWERRGHVGRDRVPAVYLHEYSAGGLTVRGLVGGLDLARRAPDVAASTVIPHEGVHAGQARELASRMAQMGMNPAPILMVHRGGGAVGRILAGRLDEPADHSYDDRAGQRHRLWALTDSDLLARVSDSLQETRALLADGHHRYAAYLELQERFPDTGWDRGLVMLVDQDETPLHLGAIHRVLPGADVATIATAAVDAGFGARPATRTRALEQLGRATPVAGSGDDWRVLDLQVGPDDLAVCLLHDRIIPRLPAEARVVTHHHSAQEAIAAAEATGGTALLVPAVEFDVVVARSAAGRLLPEKATSFQPKPSVGVLMRSPLDE